MAHIGQKLGLGLGGLFSPLFGLHDFRFQKFALGGIADHHHHIVLFGTADSLIGTFCP